MSGQTVANSTVTSLLGKQWVIKNANPALGLVDKLLQNRGIDTPEKREKFFNEGTEGLHDPLLLKDMDKAMARIRAAVDAKEKIMVFGDYDVDGITGTAMLYSFLKKIGADAHYTLPHRENDGYGLKEYFMRNFSDKGVNLVITVDCGTANLKEVELANQLGMQVIVTDHHSMPEVLPAAVAVVNPKRPDCAYPNKEICGSSIAYKLVVALAPYYVEPQELAAYLTQQLSVVVLGVIGDCMQLTGENRVLVREGLKGLMAGHNPGILALLQEAGIATDAITSTTIGFQISPRINAAGRLDTPNHAFELLLGDLSKAETLNSLNTQRQVIVKEYMEEAMAQVEQMGTLPGIIVVWSAKWRAGTLGLIASKISETYIRPTVAMQDRGEQLVASLRSLNDFDITSCLRAAAGELFSAFGGHRLAGGFTLPKANLEEFLARIQKAGNDQIDPANFHPLLPIDCEITPEELSFKTVQHMDCLEPHGQGNPQPTLMIKNAQILSVKPVGKSGEHVQFPVKYGSTVLTAIAFRFGAHVAKIDPSRPYDIAFNLEINEWNGNRKLQLKVVDIKPSEIA